MLSIGLVLATQPLKEKRREKNKQKGRCVFNHSSLNGCISILGNDFDDQTSLAKIYFDFALQLEPSGSIVSWWWYAKNFPRSISHRYAFRMIFGCVIESITSAVVIAAIKLVLFGRLFSMSVSVFPFNQWLLHWVSVTVSFAAEQFFFRCGKIRMCNEPKLKLFSFCTVGMLYISLDFKAFSD